MERETGYYWVYLKVIPNDTWEGIALYNSKTKKMGYLWRVLHFYR